MALKIGLVGMPNVGKSTLFNALTNSEVEAANYPFATIEPNVAVVEVKDLRVDKLQEIFNSKKKIYNQVIFTDIAGLVKGASKGEGLGNKFLSNIRECDAIIHLVRFFENNNIIHVENTVNPIRDMQIINMELIFSDIEQIEKWKQKNAKRIENGTSLLDKNMLNILDRALDNLKNEIKLETIKWTQEEMLILLPFNFLTLKPTIYVCNFSESEVSQPMNNKYYKDFLDFINKSHEKHINISAQIEYEISKLDDANQEIFLQELNLEEASLTKLTRMCFSILNLSTYFTAGPQEIHAWAFPNNTKAPKAAGIIHSDFERGFIRADVYTFDELEKYGSEQALKDKGLIRSEGKEYIVKDGDICFFKFNV